ncbi:MAG: glycosyltransferase family 39 protein [Solirubrobacteraceae bacterium]
MSVPGQALRSRSPRAEIWLVAAITIAGLALRLPSLHDSLFGDELSAYFVVAGRSLGGVMHLLDNHSSELNPPLFFILAWTSTKLFGVSVVAMRLVSLLAGTAIIPLSFVLGRWTVGARAGLVAAALVALSPFMIYYSTEARPYALLILLVLLSTLSLLRALSSGGSKWWVAYAVFACAAAYTHFTSVFVLAAQFVWALVAQRDARRALVLASSGAAIGFLPWLPALIKTTHSPGTALYQALDPFSLHSVRIDLGRWAIGHAYLQVSQVPGDPAVALAALAVATALLGAALALGPRLARRELPRPSSRLVLVILLAAGAPVGVALYSALRESVWGARNIISSWPGYSVMLGALVSYPPRVWRGIATVMLVIAFGIGGVEMIPATYHRPDYGDAIAYIDRLAPRGGPIADLAAPTPGPPTETEVALALAASSRFHPVFRIGLPPLKAVLAAPPYTSLPDQPGELVAREVSAAAGHGLLFIVAPSSASIASFEAARAQHVHEGGSELALFASFLGALPSRWQPVTSRTFAGLAPVTVYVYRSR